MILNAAQMQNGPYGSARGVRLVGGARRRILPPITPRAHLGDIWSDIGNDVSSIANTLGQDASTIANAISAFVKNLNAPNPYPWFLGYPSIYALLSIIWPQMAADFQGLAAALTTAGGDIITFLSTVTSTLFHAILGLIEGDLAAVLALGNQMVGLLTSFVQGRFQDLNIFDRSSKIYNWAMAKDTPNSNAFDFLCAVGIILAAFPFFLSAGTAALPSLLTSHPNAISNVVRGIATSPGGVTPYIELAGAFVSLLLGGLPIGPLSALQIVVLVLENGIIDPPIGSILAVVAGDPIAQKSLAAAGKSVGASAKTVGVAGSALSISSQCFNAGSSDDWIECLQSALEEILPGAVTSFLALGVSASDLRTVMNAVVKSVGSGGSGLSGFGSWRSTARLGAFGRGHLGSFGAFGHFGDSGAISIPLVDPSVFLNEDLFPGISKALTNIGVTGLAKLAQVVHIDPTTFVEGFVGKWVQQFNSALFTKLCQGIDLFGLLVGSITESGSAVNVAALTLGTGQLSGFGGGRGFGSSDSDPTSSLTSQAYSTLLSSQPSGLLTSVIQAMSSVGWDLRQGLLNLHAGGLFYGLISKGVGPTTLLLLQQIQATFAGDANFNRIFSDLFGKAGLSGSPSRLSALLGHSATNRIVANGATLITMAHAKMAANQGSLKEGVGEGAYKATSSGSSTGTDAASSTSPFVYFAAAAAAILIIKKKRKSKGGAA